MATHELPGAMGPGRKSPKELLAASVRLAIAPPQPSVSTEIVARPRVFERRGLRGVMVDLIDKWHSERRGRVLGYDLGMVYEGREFGAVAYAMPYTDPSLKGADPRVLLAVPTEETCRLFLVSPTAVSEKKYKGKQRDIESIASDFSAVFLPSQEPLFLPHVNVSSNPDHVGAFFDVLRVNYPGVGNIEELLGDTQKEAALAKVERDHERRERDKAIDERVATLAADDAAFEEIFGSDGGLFSGLDDAMTIYERAMDQAIKTDGGVPDVPPILGVENSRLTDERVKGFTGKMSREITQWHAKGLGLAIGLPLPKNELVMYALRLNEATDINQRVLLIAPSEKRTRFAIVGPTESSASLEKLVERDNARSAREFRTTFSPSREPFFPRGWEPQPDADPFNDFLVHPTVLGDAVSLKVILSQDEARKFIKTALETARKREERERLQAISGDENALQAEVGLPVSDDLALLHEIFSRESIRRADEADEGAGILQRLEIQIEAERAAQQAAEDRETLADLEIAMLGETAAHPLGDENG